MATATRRKPAQHPVDPFPYAGAAAYDGDLRVKHPRLGMIRAEPRVVHRIREAPNGFFCHGMYRNFGFVHEFRVVIEPYATAIRLEDGPSSPSDRFVRDMWMGLHSYGDIAPYRRRLFNDDRLIIARLVVNEVPSRIVYEHSRSWAELYDDEEAAEHFAPINELRTRDDGRTIRKPLDDGGSLLLCQDLEVHPALAGNRLGGKLLLHSLWALTRHAGDLAYLEAFPIRTFFTNEEIPEEPRTTEHEMARIVRFFERAGFTKVNDVAFRPNHTTPMYRHVGAFGIPVDGVGELSALAGRKARYEPE
jgi:GNAT superfamily N-acetyltransferase